MTFSMTRPAEDGNPAAMTVPMILDKLGLRMIRPNRRRLARNRRRMLDSARLARMIATALGALGCTDDGRAKSIGGNMTNETPPMLALKEAAVIAQAAT